MSSHTAAESCLDADLADRDGNRSVTEPCGGVNTSGAPDEELALVLGVEVEQYAAGEKVAFKSECSVQPRFFRSGEKALYLAVWQLFVFKDRQLGSNAYSAVSSQCGVLGNQPPVLNDSLDRIFRKIMLHSAVLFADHVRMALQDDSRGVLPAGCRRYGNEYIAGLVGLAVEMPVCGEFLEPGYNMLLMSRFAGDGEYLAEMGQHLF